MAEQTISITLNGEAKEVAADQTGVQLFAEDKNIIAVRLNGEPRDLYTGLHDGDVVEPIALDSEDGPGHHASLRNPRYGTGRAGDPS